MNTFVANGDDVSYLGRFSGGAGEYLLDKEVKRYWLSEPLDNSSKVRFYLSLLRTLLQRTYSKFKIRNLKGFDMVFIGLQGLSPELIVDRTEASKIGIFIRTDISSITKKDQVVKNLRSNIKNLDYYICVAETVRDSLIKEIPEAASKAVVIYNILAPEDMKKKLNEAPNPFISESDNTFRIVSVCRISDKSKALFRMVRVCKRLVDDGYKFRWYIVGDGEDLPELKDYIGRLGLQNVIITPGKVDNPFGYYRECNLVAMMSYYEGLCGVVNEAKISGKAIIATEVSGIYEQLQHGVNGWIVKNDEEQILDGMRYLLNNRDIVNSMANTIYPQGLVDDNAKIEKLYSLID